MFLFKKKDFFAEEEKEKIVKAIRRAEKLTSGEVRVYIESRCRYVNPMDRALEIFARLNMHKTKDKNGVLLYIALKDKQFAICGDEGIHAKVGDHFWQSQAQNLIDHFQRGEWVKGIEQCVLEIGWALQQYFPYESDDKNELPDDIVFGK